MELIISESKRKNKEESESAIKIGKRYLTKANKKVQDKVNGKETKAKNQTAKSIAIAKENKRFKDQLIALRTKYKTALTNDINKAKNQHKAKLVAIRKGVSAKPAPNAGATKPQPK